MDDPDMRELLLDIARCQIVASCLANPNAQWHACSEVVSFQATAGQQAFQVPEPWNGHLQTAPILFVSSNPSLAWDEEYPIDDQTAWPDDRVVDFFEYRFGGGTERWTLEARRALQRNGAYAPRDGVFWSQVAGKARDILGRQDVRGKDWALTEVVHCKSQRGIGVARAANFCADRYLERIIHSSSARIIVSLGRKNVWPVVQRVFAIPEGSSLVGPVVIAGSVRYVAFLEHPGAGSPHLSKLIPQEKLIEIRQFIAN